SKRIFLKLRYDKRRRDVEMDVKKVQIVWVKLDGSGSEQQGNPMPCIVVQNNVGNKFSYTTIIVPLTRRIPKRLLLTHVTIEGKHLGRYFEDSTILTEQIKVIDVQRIIRVQQKLPKTFIDLIDEKMLISLGIESSAS